MTPEEIRENLFRTLDRLDALCADKTNVESLPHKERETHELEMANVIARHKADLVSKDKEIADRDKEIADRDKVIAGKDSEIERLRKALAEKEQQKKTALSVFKKIEQTQINIH